MSYFIKGRAGRVFEARLEIHNGSVILHSRSGASRNRPPRNRQYTQAFDEILERLTAGPEAIERVLLDSAPARKKPESMRLLAVREDFEKRSLTEVASQIRTKMRAFGRNPTMPAGEGNSNKRLRFDTSLTDAQLKRRLRLTEAAGSLQASFQKQKDVSSAPGELRAIESKSEIQATAAAWRDAFSAGASVVGTMEGCEVLWHDDLGIWGCFGKTAWKKGRRRDWNAFGQQQNAFRNNIIVEINQPPTGIDTNLQAVFAKDAQARTWLLHQGRMSVSGSRITEADFIVSTGLAPVTVQFSNGLRVDYHKVACLDAKPQVIRENISQFIAQCARARTIRLAGPSAAPDLSQTEKFEKGFSPEKIGSYAIAAREASKGKRLHGRVQRALAAELMSRNVPHSNDRVRQYGPDLYTWGKGGKILFEIKSGASANDVFAAVGQLHIYDILLGGGYRRVLVIPEGMKEALKGPLSSLEILVLEFSEKSRKIAFDTDQLSASLA